MFNGAYDAIVIKASAFVARTSPIDPRKNAFHLRNYFSHSDSSNFLFLIKCISYSLVDRSQTTSVGNNAQYCQPKSCNKRLQQHDYLFYFILFIYVLFDLACMFCPRSARESTFPSSDLFSGVGSMRWRFLIAVISPSGPATTSQNTHYICIRVM